MVRLLTLVFGALVASAAGRNETVGRSVHGGGTVGADPLPETDWLAEAGHGVFTHYLDSLQNNFGRNSQGKNSSWDACVAEFDAEAYAESAAAAGAQYAVITMMQGSRQMIAPNSVYDNFTGYAPGEACSTRDLVLDISAALNARGLKLMLYWTGDGPHLDPQARKGLGWPDSPSVSQVPAEFVRRWSLVLQEYAQRYSDKVSGWWIDGCYSTSLGYTDNLLKPYHDAIRAGNPSALVAFNNGVHHPIGVAPDRISQWSDFTCGESNDFTDLPPSRFVSQGNATAQWHTLINLGSQWAASGECTCTSFQDTCLSCTPLSADNVHNYTTMLQIQQGAITVDLQLLRNGSMNAQQIRFLAAAWQGLSKRK